MAGVNVSGKCIFQMYLAQWIAMQANLPIGWQLLVLSAPTPLLPPPPSHCMLNQFAKVWLNVLPAFCCVFLLPVAAHKWNRYKDRATDTAIVADTVTDTLSLCFPLPLPLPMLPHMRHIRQRSLKRTKATALPLPSFWSCSAPFQWSTRRFCVSFFFCWVR